MCGPAIWILRGVCKNVGNEISTFLYFKYFKFEPFPYL